MQSLCSRLVLFLRIAQRQIHIERVDLRAKRSDTSEKDSPVASQPLIAGSYFPVCPTMSGGAKLHITNGYWPLFTALQTLKQKLIVKARTKLEMLQGQFPLYDTTSCKYSCLASREARRDRCFRRLCIYWYQLF